MGKLSPADDTIVAVATAPGRGAVGVVRVSGPGCPVIAEGVLGQVPAPRVVRLGSFKDSDGRAIDQGIALFFRGPHSYTGEDVLEFQGHGNPILLEAIVSRCLELGARPARAGEFTERAYLNGKFDLAQAEAVADTISAGSVQAARAAVASLQGRFSTEVLGLAGEIRALRMLVEAVLDFPDEESDFLQQADFLGRVGRLGARVLRLLEIARRGVSLQGGLRVAIVGAPNVGKSSLLNALAEDEVALVSDIAGTTRDAVRERVVIGGVEVLVVDTAGIRGTDDPVERMGIARARREAARADVVLVVEVAGEGGPGAGIGVEVDVGCSAQVVRIANKADLVCGEGLKENSGVIWCSALTGEGIDAVRSALVRIALGEMHEDGLVSARTRHVACLERVLELVEVSRARETGLELVAEDLRSAHEALGEITGEVTSDEILGDIFSSFCIGK